MRLLIYILVYAFLSGSSHVQAQVVMSDYKDYLENGAPSDWTRYPTYEAYELIMEKWARDYPQVCRLYDLGPSVKDRKILALKVSDSANRKEPEPGFLLLELSAGRACRSDYGYHRTGPHRPNNGKARIGFWDEGHLFRCRKVDNSTGQRPGRGFRHAVPGKRRGESALSLDRFQLSIGQRATAAADEADGLSHQYQSWPAD